MTKTPNSRRNLDEAIRGVAGLDASYVKAKTIVANAIVGQMLPEGVVKGGSALKLRYGDAGTRFTTDLDVARRNDLDSFVGELDGRLAQGWPSPIVKNDGWDSLYSAQAEGLDVLQNVDDAVEWANGLIDDIASA